MNFGDAPFLVCSPTLNLVRFVPKPAIVKDLWEESSGAEGGRGKQEKWRRPTFLPRLLWPSGYFPMCQVTPGPWVPQTPRVTMENTTASYQAPSHAKYCLILHWGSRRNYTASHRPFQSYILCTQVSIKGWRKVKKWCMLHE